MHFNISDVFYSQYSHRHVSAAAAAILTVALLLQEYGRVNVVSCVTATPLQLKIGEKIVITRRYKH
jgi:hypothetical protein